MAEAALFSLASKVLATIASPAIQMAYERAHSICRGARNDLEELRTTIQTIQATLLDAEKQQEDSDSVKNWIQRVRDVLYEADDLLDEVVTNDMLKHRIKGNKVLATIFLSNLNSVVFNDSVSKKVKAIRRSLRQICDDMTQFKFVKCQDEKTVSGMRRGGETGSFVDPKEVFGRDDDKKVIIEFIYDESYAEKNISLVAVVGIGGMGKSALAQLIYNDEKILNDFNEKRWWVCISDTFDEKDVVGRIFQSLTGKQYRALNLGQLQSEIRKCISMSGKFLLVLDDLWDENKARGRKLCSLLSSDDAKGSKIIVTTRSSSVAKAMDVDEIHGLLGLSNDASWELFKRFAFTPDQESDPKWNSLGRKIVKKCANVPLAIKSIASLLNTKDTLEEWQSFEDEELSKIELCDDSIMSTLRLSYNHLPSNLKHCFAYCSLFPKDSVLNKKKMIYLWISQGYVKPTNNTTVESAGHAYFMELLRRSFFQEVVEVADGEIVSCKMHDLIHDLAQHVAEKESIVLTERMTQFHKKIRHVSVGCTILDSWDIPPPLLEANRIRSFLFMPLNCPILVLGPKITKFKFLRALYLQALGIGKVPSFIGELKHLRYLSLANNEFSNLPQSITKLVNLLTLDVSCCYNLIALPNDFRKLVNLRHLDISWCPRLWHMPPGFDELTTLQHLSDFKLSKTGCGKSSGLDSLANLSLSGELSIHYDESGDWSEDEMLMLKHAHIPTTLESQCIYGYPSTRIPIWWRDDPTSLLPKLNHLTLHSSVQVQHLPPLRCIPYLRVLKLCSLENLEYIEGDEVVDSATPFFPSLQKLSLECLPRLKGWSRRRETIAESPPLFPLLLIVVMQGCPLLQSLPSSPLVQTLWLREITKEVLQQLVSTCSNSPPSSSLQDITVYKCNGMRRFEGQGLTSLRKLWLEDCKDLNKVQLAPKGRLEEFTIYNCPDLRLWDSGVVDWNSLTCLRVLRLNRHRESETIPRCLQQLVGFGKLKIEWDHGYLALYKPGYQRSESEDESSSMIAG